MAPVQQQQQQQQHHLQQQAPTLSLSEYAANVADSEQASRRRRMHASGPVQRISGVSSRQTRQMVAEQAKALCSRYLRSKLRNCCIPSQATAHKRLGLQRLKSLEIGFRDGILEIAHELRELGMEMERSHPELFSSVVENVGLRTVPSQTVLQNLFRSLTDELFREEVTWGKLVALYAMTGTLAIDCVKHGRPEYILVLVKELSKCVEKENVSAFLLRQGGWGGLLTRFRRRPNGRALEIILVMLVTVVLLTGTIWNILVKDFLWFLH